MQAERRQSPRPTTEPATDDAGVLWEALTTIGAMLDLQLPTTRPAQAGVLKLEAGEVIATLRERLAVDRCQIVTMQAATR